MIIVNNSLERMWNEVAVAYFKLLFQNLFGGVTKATKRLSQCTRCPGRDSKPRPS